MSSKDGHSSSSSCCVLCNCIRSDGSLDEIRQTLWKAVWTYMLPRKHHDMELDEPRADDAWVLASCALTGCMETMCFILHHLLDTQDEIDIHKTKASITTASHLISQRTSSDFPLPDSWVHQCVRLALNPLHLACWKLDFHMVQILLDLGANPNALALEKCVDLPDASNEHSGKSDFEEHAKSDAEEIGQNENSSHNTENASGASVISSTPTPIKSVRYQNPKKNAISRNLKKRGLNYDTQCSVESENNSKTVSVDDEMFDLNTGLSPLDFVVLGVRCPPMHSMELASRHGVIHNTQENCPDKFRSMCSRHDCVVCQSFLSHKDTDGRNIYCSSSSSTSDLPNSNYDDEEFDEDPMKKQMLIKCIELLVSAGANLNQGYAKCLRFNFPLDVLIQPPIDIYYGPMMGRSTQISVNIRRHNLASNLPYVTSACHEMISHNARLSTSFISLYKWKPQYMDCFAIDPSRHAIELIKIITQLGLFSDFHPDPLYKPCRTLEYYSENRHPIDSNNYNENRQIALQKNVETFTAGIVNNESPMELVSTVFESISVSTIHLFCKIATRILESSEFEHVYLSALVQRAIQSQMRTLVHSSMLIILNSMDVTQASIQALPIPEALKRRLLCLAF